MNLIINRFSIQFNFMFCASEEKLYICSRKLLQHLRQEYFLKYDRKH